LIAVISLGIVYALSSAADRRLRRLTHAVLSNWLIGVVIFLVVATASCAALLYLDAPDSHVPEALIAALVSAAVTLMLVLAALFEIRGISKTASADLIFRLTTRFFELDNRILVTLIDGDYLLYESRDPIKDSYFVVDEEKILASGLHGDIKVRLSQKKAYTVQEIDDFLGQFDDLNDLERAGTLDLKLIWSAFSSYLNGAWKNGAVKSYIEAHRAVGGWRGSYGGFESLVQRCNRYEESLE
jgi:hypothetical protein